jgi:hypothetical protein
MNACSKAVLLVALIGAAGCEEKKSDAGGDAPAKATETAAAKPKQPAPEAGAFFMGRKYAFACTYAMLGEAAQAQKTHGEANTFATSIGVAVPPVPSKEDAMKAMRAPAPGDEIKKKHGDKASAAYALGVALTDAFFGANLEADIGPALAEVEKNAKAAGVPETVWKDKLDAVKAKASTDGVTALARAFETHYKT